VSAPHLSQIRSAVPARQTGAAISLSQQCGSQHTRTAATAHWLWLGWTPRPKPEQPDPNPALAKGIPLTSSPPLSLSLSLSCLPRYPLTPISKQRESSQKPREPFLLRLETQRVRLEAEAASSARELGGRSGAAAGYGGRGAAQGAGGEAAGGGAGACGRTRQAPRGEIPPKLLRFGWLRTLVVDSAV